MTDAPPSPDADRDAKPGAEEATFVSTPYGLFTEQGIWFHVPEEELRDYAGDVVDAVGLEQLVAWASTWLHSPRTLALWLLPALLWVLPTTVAAIATVGIHALWRVVGPSVVSEWAATAFGWLENVLAQAFYYTLLLSALAAAGQETATIVALVGFVALRFRAVDKAVELLSGPIVRSMYALPLPDQILRAFLIRVALNRRLPIPQIDDMAHDMMERWNDDRKPGR
jgi:hypothetical protein